MSEARPSNVGAVSIWASADASSGYVFCWQHDNDFSNFTLTMTEYGCDLQPGQYRLRVSRGHQKPPADVVQWAQNYCAAQAQPTLWEAAK